MLDLVAVGSVIRAGLAVATLLVVVRYVLRPTLVEVFRQRVFELRRELFLLRLDGVVAPSSPAYQLLMRSFNGTIRFAEAFSFGRMLIMLVFPAPESRLEYDALDAALHDVPEPLKATLAKFRTRLGYEIVRHIVYTSPLAWALLVVVVPLVHLLSMIRATHHRIWAIADAASKMAPVKRMEAEASAMLPDDFAQVC